MATYRLNPVDWVFVSRDIPYSNDRTSQTVSLMTTGYAPGYLILRFDQLPENLWYKNIEDVFLFGYCSLIGAEPYPEVHDGFLVWLI